MSLFSPLNELPVAVNGTTAPADIPVSQEALASVLEREKYYHSLLDHLPLAAYACDKSGRITYYNEAAVRLWGYRPAIHDPALKYCACYKVYSDGQYITPAETPMAIALQTGQSFNGIKAIVERPDGSTFHACVYINPLFDEQKQLTGAINIFQDISETTHASLALVESESSSRKQTAQLEKLVLEQTIDLTHKNSQLRQTEEQYQKMVEEVEDYAIILLDKDGIIQNWNRGAEKIKGYREEEIVGRSFQDFYLPEDRATGLPLQLLEEARSRGKAVHEGWRRRKDGSAFWGSILLTALHNDQYEVTGFSKVTRDLTERKLAEDKVKEYLAQLEFQNKELEQFAYACSHDIKEPLRKVLLYNHFIGENPNNVLDEKSQVYLKRSLQAAERMKKLIDDLLTYSLHTSQNVGFGPLDLHSVLGEIAQELKEELEDKQVRIVIKTTLPVLQAIPFQVKQLFYNLLQNAIKYKHPDREGCIEISSDVVQRDSMQATSNFYYKVTVADNGIGFGPENATNIFKLFQRLQPASGEPGSGIGLAICKKIVQNHKGIIEAEGQPGVGASFHIYLPVQ